MLVPGLWQFGAGVNKSLAFNWVVCSVMLYSGRSASVVCSKFVLMAVRLVHVASCVGAVPPASSLPLALVQFGAGASWPVGSVGSVGVFGAFRPSKASLAVLGGASGCSVPPSPNQTQLCVGVVFSPMFSPSIPCSRSTQTPFGPLACFPPVRLRQEVGIVVPLSSGNAPLRGFGLDSVQGGSSIYQPLIGAKMPRSPALSSVGFGSPTYPIETV